MFSRLTRKTITSSPKRFVHSTKVLNRKMYKRKAQKMDEIGDKVGSKKKGAVCESILPDNWFDDNKSRMFVGAHVSSAGGIYNSVYNAASIGCQSFAMFLANQRTFNVKPLEDADAERFKKAVEELGYKLDLILPHSSYLMNPGSPDSSTLSKSRSLFLDGMQRCEKLGIKLFNFHPGSTCGKIDVSKCLDNIAESINYVLGNTNGVVAVIENMSRQGNTVGGDFKEIKGIIDRVKDKSRVGVCLDTCHTFAAGYDLRSDVAYEKTMEEFDRVIGFKYLRGVHLNDSKGALNSHLDRHENIGKGQLGMKVFTRIMKDERFRDIPIILETPSEMDVYAAEIKLLYGTLEEM